jgi:ribosomal-protein-alanine N-acetyltransferase
MIPSFETERLILRQVQEGDAPAYARHFIDYEIIRHMNAAVPWPYPEPLILDYIKAELLPRQGTSRWTWGLFLKTAPDELIGVVDIWTPANPINRGFWIGRNFWNQGLMSEALLPVMDYVFDVLDFEKVILGNATGNMASRRIKEKTGARLLRIEPQQFVDPTYMHSELWELPREAWRRLRGTRPVQKDRGGKVERVMGIEPT